MPSRHGSVNYGIYTPNFGISSHPRTLSMLASEAEKAGWDGFFLWDHLIERNLRVPITDSFIALSAIAQQTSRIRIGTTVIPLPKLKPWIVARQTVALDQLSNGRMILGVGLGLEETCAYERLNESADNKILAEKLDESLEIITGLWSGRPFSYEGKHLNRKNHIHSETCPTSSYTHLGRGILAKKGTVQTGRQMGRGAAVQAWTRASTQT